MFIGHDSTDTIRYFKVNIFSAVGAAIHKLRAFIYYDDDDYYYLNPVAGTVFDAAVVVVIVIVVLFNAA